MLTVAHRSRVRRERAGWYLLLSGVLHLLPVVALSLTLTPSDHARLPKESPVYVSLVRPEVVEEPQKADVIGQAPSRAQIPEGPRAEAAQATETALPIERVGPTELSPDQARKEPQPRTAPPAAVAPPPTSHVTSKRETAPPRRATTAGRPPPTATQPQRTAERALEHERFAKLLEPAVPMPPTSSLQSEPADQVPVDMAPQAEPHEGWLHGRIPLLSGDDLDKYAMVRSSDQRGSSGDTVSLDTKEIKYLSYFAHIKRKIERVWGYPSEAVANGLQGQLQLKFVLLRTGQVKTVELLRSSGYKALDKEAWDAVINGAPFNPFPPTIPDDELHITARFTYLLTPELQRATVR